MIRWYGVRAAALVVTVLLFWEASWADERADSVAPAAPRAAFRGAAAHKVLRVVSADTVIVRVAGEGRRLALIGVEIPASSRPAAQEATRFLENLLAGESVYVEHAEEEPPADQFGRYPAYLYRAPDGLFVNLELVRQGYAGVPDQPAFEHRETFKRFEARARDAEKGCWARLAQVQNTREKPEPPATRAAEPEQSDDSSGDVIVYITASGKKYHRVDCYHLRKSSIPIKLSAAKARGYEPCSHCKPPP